MTYPQIINKLPIVSHLDEICAKLVGSPSRFLVLTAQTAAGKSTALPVALLRHFSGKIVMLEPRRLAAVAIATRVAEILGEDVGKTVGYTLHLESKKSKETRLEVVTEAILTRRLLSDALLEGVQVVVLDEFHERSIHSDFALALLKEAASVRDDLFVVVMSATMDTKKLSEFLSCEAVEVEGRQFPVEIEYSGESVEEAVERLLKNRESNKRSLVNPQNTNNVEKLLTNERSAVDKPTEKFIERRDTILVFLPGIFEISRTKRNLEAKISPDEAEILTLHSSVPTNEQRKILSPVPEESPRRVILSSAIAETSLTVPGVTTVVDSGFSRQSRMDFRLGMPRLETVRESLFSAEQRSGRAGRTQAGKCVRLWGKSENLRLETECEIRRTDLSALVLECAKWGAGSIDSLEWLTPPSESAWKTAKNLLEKLGCIDPDGKITRRGEDALSLPLHPRLACVALCGEESVETVVKFSEHSRDSEKMKKAFADEIRRKLSKIKNQKERKKLTVADFLLAGFPDRIARRVEEGREKSVYQFPSGRKAVLEGRAGEWIVAPEVDAGEETGKIRSFEEISSEKAEEWLSGRTEKQTNVILDENFKIRKTERTLYGNLVIEEKKLNAEVDDFPNAVCGSVRKFGLKWLPLGNRAEEFLLRAEFFVQNSKSDGEQVSVKIENLQNTAEEWLLPFLGDGKIDENRVLDALRWHLDGRKIDENAPKEIELPNGRKRKISYEREGERVRPTLEIIIQQIFGCTSTPRVMGVPVLLRLLSPARRPLQVTQDLEHFWTGAWIEICKEMKGRYPKHNWDWRQSE